MTAAADVAPVVVRLTEMGARVTRSGRPAGDISEPSSRDRHFARRTPFRSADDALRRPGRALPIRRWQTPRPTQPGEQERPGRGEASGRRLRNPCITNKRAVYTGSRKTVEMPYAKLVNLTVYSDGIVFHPSVEPSECAGVRDRGRQRRCRSCRQRNRAEGVATGTASLSDGKRHSPSATSWDGVCRAPTDVPGERLTLPRFSDKSKKFFMRATEDCVQLILWERPDDRGPAVEQMCLVPVDLIM
jgi:hypothetical protein